MLGPFGPNVGGDRRNGAASPRRPEVKWLSDPHGPGLPATVRLTGPLAVDDQP